MIKKFLLPACLAGIAFVSNAQKTAPPPPPEPPKVEAIEFAPPVIINDGQLEEFYSRNKTVSKIARNNQRITITLKDNKVEKYNLALEADKKLFNEKYGEAPDITPPPPPPPPPTPPKVEVTAFAPPVIVNDAVLENFYSRNETVSRISWKNEKQITITRKDKTVETYNLKLEADKKLFNEKYGEAPAIQLPPPPPPPKRPAKPAAARQV